MKKLSLWSIITYDKAYIEEGNADMWHTNNFYKYSTATILVLTIIFLVGKVSYIFMPVGVLISSLFLPFLFSLTLYYILRPLLRGTERLRMSKGLGIVTIFILVVLVLGLFASYSTNLIVKQLQQLIQDIPQIVEMAKISTSRIINENSGTIGIFKQFEGQILSYSQKAIPFISTGFTNIIYVITNTASAMVLVPFILYYLLREDRKFSRKAISKVPIKFRKGLLKILMEVDKTLSTYIIGQALIAFILGLLMYIGYLIIGIKYSFLLAIFVMGTSFVPIFGAIIGVIPAIFVGMATNPYLALQVIIFAIIVQQIEGNFISPNLVGKRLSIHPLTVILIFVGATALFGFMGMLLAIPIYAVLKVLLKGAKETYTLIRKKKTI